MSSWALAFGAATGDVADCGSDTSVDDLDPFTVLCWANVNTLTSGRAFFWKGSNTVRKRFILSGTTGNVSLFVDRATDTDYITSDTPFAVLNRWVFLAGTFDSTAAVTGHIYWGLEHRDAAEATYGTTTAGSGAVSSEASSNLGWGNRVGGTTAIQGRMGPAAYCNYVFTLADVRYWQYRMLDPYWRPGRNWRARNHIWLGRGAETRQFDRSGYSNHGTVTGATPYPGPSFVFARNRHAGKPTAGGGGTAVPVFYHQLQQQGQAA